MNNHMHVVDATDSESLELLAKAYKEIYAAAVEPKDREPLEDWIQNLFGNNDVVGMTIVISGENLDTNKPVVKGLTAGYHYKGHDANLIAYTVVDERISGQEYADIQKSMIDFTITNLREVARQNGSNADGAFIELPSSDTDGLLAFQEFGAKIVNLDYVGPALCEDGEKNRDLKLAAFPGKNGYAAKVQVRDLVRAIYTGLAEYATCAPQNDPDFKAMMTQIDETNDLYGAAPKPPRNAKRIEL